MNAKPISEASRPSGCLRVGMVIFGLIFLFAGVAVLWSSFVVPMQESRRAQRWAEVECTIVASEVEERSNSDGGSTYAPKITYAYSFNGRDYESNRYSFTNFGSGRNWARRIVDEYPKNSKSKCYCDPVQPENAVLQRRMVGAAFWFGALFPWPFILVGAGIVAFSIFGGRWIQQWVSNFNAMPRSKAKSVAIPTTTGLESSNALASESDDAKLDTDEINSEAIFTHFEGPQKLRPAESRVITTVVLGIFALIWNTFIGAFTIQGFNNPANLWSLLFVAPFLLVGVFLIGTFFYKLLSLANPKVEIALSNGAVAPGESIDVAWQVFGRVKRIRNFSVIVEGTEQATYTRGTSTYTDKSVFQTITLIATANPSEREFGTRQLTIPAETIHSFQGNRNKIIWSVKYKGSIPWWPDVNESFEFKVKPRQRPTAASKP